MTNQEAFDAVAKHLLTQMKPSVAENDSQSCLYRGPDGLKCAIGALIPDDQYRKEFEYQGIDEIAQYVPALEGVSVHLLLELQLIHDDDDALHWKYALIKFATEHGLSDEVPRSFHDH